MASRVVRLMATSRSNRPPRHETWTGIAKATFRPADFHEIKLTALNYESKYDTSNEDSPTTTQYRTDVANRTVTASF